MHADFTEVHVQDLADVLSDVYDPPAITDAIRRFDVEESGIDAAENRPVDGLRKAAESGTFPKILAYLLENGEFTDEHRESLEAALSGSPVSIREGADGLELYRRIEGVADRSVRTARGFLDEHAPPVVRSHIEEAETDLASGDYDLAGAEIVRAFDALVVGGFTDGLEELVEEEVIQVGDQHEYTDANVLYVIYGYCSMIGGDPQVKGFEATRLQAELGLVTGQQALYFLVQTLQTAVENDVDLSYWEYP
ncbi:MAG: hypothetical protein ABEJ58_04950 [Halodesulfurarchaeum sp.]